MQVERTIAGLRSRVAVARAPGTPIGFVPTMGALHAGHTSLVSAAKDDGCFCVVSIFVNPTQFGPGEDFTRYPRDEAADLARCNDCETDLAFLPTVEEMYPPGGATTVHVSGLIDHLCGPQRPGHFDGVATVVAKLLNIVQPDRAYFGQKDAQQLAVIRRMAIDLNLPTRIVGCPIVREPDGLAMSSRNAYLDAAQRRQATCLNRALLDARHLIAGGQQDSAALVARMREIIESAGPSQIDYVSVVDAERLHPVGCVAKPVLIALAVRIGTTRLIDNLTVDPAQPHR